MADHVASPAPLRKRKVEASGSSAHAPKGNCFYGLKDPDFDDEMDPAEEKELSRQLRESDVISGFDVDDFPGGGIIPVKCRGTAEDPIDVTLYGRLGLHCYNVLKETNLEFKRLEKFNITSAGYCTYLITLEAMDGASGSLHPFQTCVSFTCFKNNASLLIETEVCRLKTTTPEFGRRTANTFCTCIVLGEMNASILGGRILLNFLGIGLAGTVGFDDGFEVSGAWKDREIDDSYKGDMPIWDDRLQGCYELPAQDLDLAGNDCLGLFCEVALYDRVMDGLWGCKTYKSFMPVKMKQVYVRTQEYVNPIWKAKNAIFYISFRPCGSACEYKAVVRKTMDGLPGHLRLETNALNA